MNYSLPKTAIHGFLFTAIIYLVSLSFIHYPLTTFLKPIPIFCLIIGVLQSAVWPWAKALIVIALVFSLLGDIILTLPVHWYLQLGIGCFLLTHWCYIALFFNFFKFNMIHLFYYLLILLVIGIASTLLIPNLGSLLIPVMVYAFVIMLMVFGALQVASQGLVIGVGALLFLISDVTLSFNLFLYPWLDLSIVIMLTYYSAQLLLIWGLVKLNARILQDGQDTP